MKSIFTFAIILFAVFQVPAQAAFTPIAVDPDTFEVRLEAFNKVWNTVNERHYDPTFGGVDWKKVREIYLPKARAAKTDDEFHAVLRQMLGELKLSHFGIHPKRPDIQTSENRGGTVGIDLRMLENQPVIFRVERGSPAEAAGIKTGFILAKIDGKTAKELLAPLEESFAGRKLTEAMKKVYRERTLEALTGGKAGTSAKLVVLDEKNKLRIFDIVRKPFTGEMSRPLGNFPPQEVVFQSEKLENNIGYIRFNMWVVPQMSKLRAAIRLFHDSRGIIFDIRGNPGGLGGMASGTAGLLINKQTSLGSMRSRSGSMEFIVYPQKDPFAGKIVILTDYGSGSTSEVFAAGMQEIGRAAVIGDTTAGAVLPSVFDTLPTGVIFQYAISDYRSPKNVLIEGRGVFPDISVSQTRKHLLNGRDVQLDAAIKYILN